MVAKEPLNKSHAGATTALWDGMRERRRRECDRGGRSSVFRRKMRPRSGMQAPSQPIIAVVASPSAARSRFASPSCNPLGAPFARSLTKQSARKASSRLGCDKIGRSLCCTPWHRRPSYDLRRAPCDHPDFISNALRGGFVQRFLTYEPHDSRVVLANTRRTRALRRSFSRTPA